jgi:1-acyl-sn-glycerol-3-phosphate acyltransferase
MWSPFWTWIARAFMRATGWELDGGKPEHKKYVMIAAPHTSNWDLPYMLAVAILADVDLKFMIKHSVMVGPVGWFLRKMGGIPIVRHEKRSTVQQMVDLFDSVDELALSVPPEGTRKRMPHWKSGFYRIALEAKVPLMLGFLDYGRKRGGFGRALMLTGDVKKDMDAVREWYADKTGLHHELFGPVVLETELPEAQAPGISAGGSGAS